MPNSFLVRADRYISRDFFHSKSTSFFHSHNSPSGQHRKSNPSSPSSHSVSLNKSQTTEFRFQHSLLLPSNKLKVGNQVVRCISNVSDLYYNYGRIGSGADGNVYKCARNYNEVAKGKSLKFGTNAKLGQNDLEFFCVKVKEHQLLECNIKPLGLGAKLAPNLYSKEVHLEAAASAIKLNEEQSWDSESNILQRLKVSTDSPHLIKMHEIVTRRVEVDKERMILEKLYIVTEHAKGGDLFEFISSQYRTNPWFVLDQRTIGCYLYQILQGVKACHDNGVAHLDIKLENILFRHDPLNPCEDNTLLLGDFGSAHQIPFELTLANEAPENNLHDLQKVVGTTSYSSPEVLVTKKFSLKSDIWSVGVIMHLLLTGEFPVIFNSADSGIKDLSGVDYKIDQNTPKLARLSTDAKELLENMLQVDVKKRWSVDHALKHRFFDRNGVLPIYECIRNRNKLMKQLEIDPTSQNMLISATG